GKEDASWRSLLKGKLSQVKPGERVHILDYLATPEFVLEKIGLGKGAEMLQDAKTLYRTNLKKEIDKIGAWKKSLPAGSGLKIFKYLDGEAKEVRKYMTDD